MIIARLALEKDCDDLFEWRNDPITLKSFFNHSIVEKKDHDQWFKDILQSQDSTLIILKKGKNKLGMVRYDRKNSFFHVSLNTNPEQRGKGYSSDMLLSSEKLISSKSNNIKIIADILRENKLSVRTFLRAGYKLKTRKEFFDRYIKVTKNTE